MGRLADAWERTAARKDAIAGTGYVRSANEAATLGEAWMTALFEEHGLSGEDMDEAGRVVLKVGTDTFTNLSRIGRGLPPEALVATIFAAGFSNGLALGLELGCNG